MMNTLFLRPAARWRWSCLRWAPRCSAGIWWVVGRLWQHFCCRALRRACSDPAHAEHIQQGWQWFLSKRQICYFNKYSNGEGHAKASVILPQVAKLANRLFCDWGLLRNNCMATNLQRFTSSYGCILQAVLSLLWILSLDWNFWPFSACLGDFRKSLKMCKTIHFGIFYKSFIFNTQRGAPTLRCTTTDLGTVLCKIAIFWSCVCESPACRWFAACDRWTQTSWQVMHR